MDRVGWPEAANRRLRALLWKRLSVAEVAAALGRSIGDVRQQMERLGLPHGSARKASSSRI